MKLCNLDDILKYRNEHVIERYCKDFNATSEEAEKLFVDTLRFLWISAKNNYEKKCDLNSNSFVAMHHEMIAIDNMWHTFILFTKDYTDFGNKYFGHYLHHQPTLKDDPKPTKEEFEKQFRAFLSYVYDHLGEDTLRRWFSEYCQT